MGKFQGRVAIVTGGGGGMGRVHALHFARLGADVAVIDLDLDIGRQRGETWACDSVAQELRALGVQAIGIAADLSDPLQAAGAIDKATAALGRIDILVNNAGGAITPIERSTPTQSPPDDTSLLFAANFHTMVHCCQAAVPHMTRPGGSIVNVSTAAVARDMAGGRMAMYAAAKAAVERYTRSLAVELGPQGIRVNCVAPGFVETARIKAASNARNIGTSDQAARVPLRRLGQPEDVSGVVSFLAGDASAYVTGECICVTGGAALVGVSG